MNGTIVCPHCKCTLNVPPSAFGKLHRCPRCQWSIDIPHPDVPPPSDIVLGQQDDILADYHERLEELYERTTSLIEAVRARRADAEAEVNDVLMSERQRVLYLVEMANRQMKSIIEASEMAAPRAKFVTRFPNKLRCPHCRRTVRYKDRAAGNSLQCPNPYCGRPIAIPSPGEGFWLAVNFSEGRKIE